MKYHQMMGFGGSIVNLSAVNGLVGIRGLVSYTVAKHGIIGLTQTAALGFACQGIRINAVASGYVQTPRMSELPENIVRSFTNSHSMKRMQKSLYINLCNCLILICSIQHQKQVNLWTKNSCRLWLTNWPKISKPLKISASSIAC
ncbi:SDR family NAD(P)-dependent oxidoreductase [Klebsiella aerogenes]